ncbi:hypothetical protein PG995_013442 [Apiospora arundinis]
MAVQGGAEEDVYLTLLMNDTYLPGALVLGHSLRDAGTSKKLGAMVTLDTVAAEAITQLKAVYDYILPVPRIKNPRPSNLSLMNRTDLHSAFTKINLWKQTNFRKIVYLDADIVAYRAPDELFDLEQPFSAAPDIGWPDLFNTGVMVLTPNLGDYYALTAMAERGISFDGADQGLLNMHFKNDYNRISFSYNVTPSAHYQYVPAYRHFQSSINMVHFIGSDKPWFQGRYAATGSGVFDEMTGRWWAVYDRHYRADTLNSDPSQPSTRLVQYLTKGEYRPSTDQVQGSEPRPITYSGWDAQRQPPPADTKPEAANFPATVYEMSRDTAPFVPPGRYPSPPKNLSYQIPHHVKPKAIFPWEINQEAPTRVFAEDAHRQEANPSAPTKRSPTEPKEEPMAPTTPTLSVASSDPWSSFARTNAWDEVPEIERYVDTLQKHQRSGSLKSPGMIGIPSQGGEVVEREGARRGSKLTDFPSEMERPSLPVTPAPIRRPKFWGGGGSPGIHDDDDDETSLPAAEGVPQQSDWDPAAQLQKLAKQQSEMLLQKLGSSGSGSSSGRRDSNDLPARPVPFGSEELTSPTYVPQTAKVLSPQPVKGPASSSVVRGIVSDDESTPRASASQSTAAPPPPIAAPSYSGPGAAFEKGEDIPQHETALPPERGRAGCVTDLKAASS